MPLQQNGQEQFKIPLTIEQHKADALLYKILSTLIGIETNEFKTKNIALWVILFATFVVLKFIPKVPYEVFIGVNIGVCFIIGLVQKVSESVDADLIHKAFMSCLFGYLWSHQLYHSNLPSLMVLTLISIATSIGPIILVPIPQFASPTLYIKQFSIDSVLYIRLLLPLPLFIVQLILDYGTFLSQSSNHLYYIRLTISLVFLAWIFGWISTVYNTFFFLCNNINRFFFGDSSKAYFISAFLSLVLNFVPIASYYSDKKFPFWTLGIGSTLSSIVSFFISNYLSQKSSKVELSFRIIFTIIIELVICGSLIGIMESFNFNQLSSPIEIVTILDVSIYAFFILIRFVSLPRNCLGWSFNIKIFNSHLFRAIERISLRIIAGFTVIILIQNLNIFQLWMKLDQILNFDIDINFVQYFFAPFLVYRSFKRAISSCTSFSFHFSVLISLYFIIAGRQLESILVVLVFPPFPHNIMMAFIAPLTTPPKLRHKYEFLYVIVYLCITAVSTVIFTIFLGTLEFSMLFGLPFFVCVLPTLSKGTIVRGKQNSLYQKIIQYIPRQLFTFQSQGFYLIRISKYILLVQIKQELYGFGEIIDIKGLEVQEVTSCHSKEGQTIDKLVEQTWGNLAQIFNPNHLFCVLAPLKKQLVYVPTENEIQLTGIIQSQQFVNLFKQAALKAFTYEVSQIDFSEQQLLEAEQIITDLPPICKKDKFQNLFPFQFANQLKMQVQYPSNTVLNCQNKKKLPPLKSKKQFVSDFMDLLEISPKIYSSLSGQTSTQQLNSITKNLLKEQQLKDNEKSQKNLTSSQKVSIKELRASLIMAFYHYSVGKFDYCNVKKLYSLINQEKGEMTQIKFQSSEKILQKALSKAFKIAIDKTISGETNIELTDVIDFQQRSFLGISGSEDYNNAIAKDLQDIWMLQYNKGKLSVKRLARAENQLYMFKADASIIKSVWNNLRFELLYAANDNDQRYSIQTHASLLRNLWTQACEEPFGYPSFHSGNMLNC